jgi:hypothetical protein
MFDPVNRREFLEQTAVAAVGVGLVGCLTMPAESVPAAEAVSAGAPLPAGQAAPTGLMSQIDPILRPIGPPLAEAENALPLLKQAAKHLTPLPGGGFDLADCFGIENPDAQRDRRIAAWIDRHEHVIPLVEQAVARGNLAFPNTTWTVDRIIDLWPLLLLARLLQLRAQRLVSEGKLVEGAQASRTLSEAFRLLAVGDGGTVEYLNAIHCEANAWTSARHVAAHPKADDNFVRSLLAGLPVHDPLEGLRRAARAECCNFLLPVAAKTEGADLAETVEIMLGWTPRVAEFSPRKDYELQRKTLLQLFEGHPTPYDRADTLTRATTRSAEIIRDLDLPWQAFNARPQSGPPKELAAWPEKLSMSLDFGTVGAGDVTDAQVRISRKELLSTENPLGRKFVESYTGASRRLREMAEKNQAQYEATRLFLAIRIFALEHGKLPADLDALLGADILHAMPPDPFAAEPFHYSPAKRVLWSVGADGRNAPAEANEASDFEVCVWRLDACLR